MNEICQKSENFLAGLLTDLRFDLSVSTKETEEGCFFDLKGNDISLLLSENGECWMPSKFCCFKFTARNSTAHSDLFVMRMGIVKRGVRNFRRWRVLLLKMFVKDGKPFTFGKLNSTERRIIHMSLVDETDLQTESIGEGRERRLQVRLKISSYEIY